MRAKRFVNLRSSQLSKRICDYISQNSRWLRIMVGGHALGICDIVWLNVTLWFVALSSWLCEGLLLIGVPGAWENLCFKTCAIGDRASLWKEDASTIFSRGLGSWLTFGAKCQPWSQPLRRWQKQKARKQLIDVVTGCNCCARLLCVWDRCSVRAAEQHTKPCCKALQSFFPVIGFVRIAVDMILFYLIMQLRQKEQSMSLD